VPQPVTPPPAASSPLAPDPGVGSADATQYVEVPRIGKGKVVGVLVGIDGEFEGELFGIHEGDNKIGRSQECGVHLLDPKVSREHAMIAYDDEVLLILPLSGKNPTYLNDEMVEEGDQLSDGDKLRFGSSGSSTFRFRTIEGL